MTVAVYSTPFAISFSNQPLDTAIIAGTGEDVSVDDLLDYIKPVLRGMDDGRWITCCFESGPDGEIAVRAAASTGHVAEARYCFLHDAELQSFREEFPIASGLVVVLLVQYAPQVYQLLDGISSWLTMVEAKHPSISPFVEILEDLSIWQ